MSTKHGTEHPSHPHPALITVLGRARGAGGGGARALRCGTVPSAHCTALWLDCLHNSRVQCIYTRRAFAGRAEARELRELLCAFIRLVNGARESIEIGKHGAYTVVLSSSCSMAHAEVQLETSEKHEMLSCTATPRMSAKSIRPAAHFLV
jgi:hypothetical protein